ncbi:hypothetical protein PC116_g15731 [Phytophthora cactorum]|nr:hypothetical protein PC116_g15731 [Phytophthora cactorum]
MILLLLLYRSSIKERNYLIVASLHDPLESARQWLYNGGLSGSRWQKVFGASSTGRTTEFKSRPTSTYKMHITTVGYTHNKSQEALLTQPLAFFTALLTHLLLLLTPHFVLAALCIALATTIGPAVFPG